MGELINLENWKQKREALELANLKEKVKALIAEIGEPETGPYHLEETDNEFISSAVRLMLGALDGYTKWPIDSTDL